MALLERFSEEQIEAFRQALPADIHVVDVSDDGGVLGSAEFVVVWRAHVDERVLGAAAALRCVIKLGSGPAAIAEPACTARGIDVVRVASPSLISVAEHTIMMLLALLKRFHDASDRLRSGIVIDGAAPELTTQDSYAYNWVGLERFEALFGKRVGLVGLGRIGLAVASRLHAFGAQVLYTKRHRLSPEVERGLGATFLPLHELLAASHCVSLHLPFTPDSERLIGGREFALMPRGSFFVNTARGRLVDEEALVRALGSGHLAGAALDVFRFEPLPQDSPLLETPNLLLTPHTAGIPIDISIEQEFEAAGRAIVAALAVEDSGR